jgi:hypothetical protein
MSPIKYSLWLDMSCMEIMRVGFHYMRTEISRRWRVKVKHMEGTVRYFVWVLGKQSVFKLMSAP